tara:strand:- start:805 stop:1785 length:981 start_codon:yes stop_codon:yes gene_type:complete
LNIINKDNNIKNILIYNSGGGLGDSIQLFPLILSLQNHFKSANFFYLGAHKNHYNKKLKEFNINISTLELDLKYFGFRWWHFFCVKKNFYKKKLDKMDLVIDLQSKIRNTIILKQIPHKSFYSSTFNYNFCTNKKHYSSKDHLVNISKFLENEIVKIKFNLNNLSKEYIDEARRLLPEKNYIGFSLTQGNTYRKKSWSIKKFIELANKIKEKNKKPIFFIEKDNIDLINKIKSEVPEAFFPELNSNISCPALVTALTARLELAISIDNGVMHMMSLANIPMIVLFGPTDSKKFAPNDNLVKIVDSKEIYNSNDIDKILVNDIYNLI